MYTLIVTLHVILAFVIIISILVFQTSKGSALSMFGGGGDALFNAASGTSFIKKFTAGAAALFAVTSLLLTILGSSNRFRSVVMDPKNQLQQPPPQQAAPAQPGAANPAPAAAKPEAAKPAPAPEKK